jgi:hypothetical protein
MSTIRIMTSHSDRTGTDYYREFDLLDYGDLLPEGAAVEVKADPDDHNDVWNEYPRLVLWKIVEPDGGARYVARPEGRYQVCADTATAYGIIELYDSLADAKAAYEKYAAAKEGECSLYDQKQHEMIDSYDPEEE